jgi:hypothetical protein
MIAGNATTHVVASRKRDSRSATARHTVAVKMNETYAATIAAVAPVIWLVAIVEWHQFVRGLESVSATREALARARRRASQIEEPASLDELAQVRGLLAQVRETAESQPEVNPIKRATSFVYLFVAALLLAAESMSLIALGEGPKDNDWMAWFCCAAILIGFLVITVMPSYVAYRVSEAAADGVTADLSWIAAWLARHESLDGPESGDVSR